MVNARARCSAFEKRIRGTLGGRTGAQRIFRAQDFSFQKRDARLKLMCGELRQILTQDDIGLGFFGASSSRSIAIDGPPLLFAPILA